MSRGIIGRTNSIPRRGVRDYRRPVGRGRVTMFLTACAVCAKALDNDNDEARYCGKCQTRFCGEACESEHRAQAQICDDTAEGGGAELIHINEKTTEAWEHALSSCAEEAAGKTCYICMEIVDAEGEGCVRGCACRGDSAGFAHLSCLISCSGRTGIPTTPIRFTSLELWRGRSTKTPMPQRRTCAKRCGSSKMSRRRRAASSDPHILTRRNTRGYLRKQRRRSPKSPLRETTSE